MKNLFIILIVLVLQFSCKPPLETLYIPEEMKPYIMFPEGSYWVYEDSATLQTDSFYLKSIYTEFYPKADGENIEYEKIIQDFYNIDSPNQIALGRTFLDYYNQLYYNNFYDEVFRHDIPIGDSVNFDGIKVKHIITYDSIIISGNHYKNVMVLDKRELSRAYWCKNIGMIRREIFKTSIGAPDTLIVLNLKKYYINN
jgi:hypothetical protein